MTSFGIRNLAKCCWEGKIPSCDSPVRFREIQESIHGAHAVAAIMIV